MDQRWKYVYRMMNRLAVTRGESLTQLAVAYNLYQMLSLLRK